MLDGQTNRYKREINSSEFGALNQLRIFILNNCFEYFDCHINWLEMPGQVTQIGCFK